jgi:hypothetical protein
MMRFCVGAFGLLALTACSEPAVTRAIALADDTVSTTAPAGYCVDPVASNPNRDFAVLAPCATLGSDGGIPNVIGVATVQVGADASGAIAQDEIALRDFLITNQGASLLSQNGDAADITILSTQAFSDQVMVHFNDAGVPPITGLQSQEWRAFRDVSGRLVTVGVRGLAIAPLQDGPGAALLKLILAGVQTMTDSTDAPET